MVTVNPTRQLPAQLSCRRREAIPMSGVLRYDDSMTKPQQPRAIHLLLLSILSLSFSTAIAQPPQPPSFEVATVRAAPPGTDSNTGNWNYPGTGRFTATHLSLATLIKLAYDVDKSQIADGPGWLDTNLYDIDAKAEDGLHLTRDELKPRLRTLLHDRFHLVVHTETRPVSGYALVVAKGGPHLIPTTKPDFRGDFADITSGNMKGFHWTMPQLAKYLSPPAGFPVVDETGIAGKFDISFTYNPKPDDSTSNLLPLSEALKQATGLQLNSRKVPVQTIVIDSVDKVPTEN
jgi:uncharacterized protein (TIGR03435 family)